jgi:hypothetical protein
MEISQTKNEWFFFLKLVIINNEKRMDGRTQKRVVQYLNCCLIINMQQLEKQKTKATRSICTSVQEMLKGYKTEEPTPCLQQLEGEKEIHLIQNPNLQKFERKVEKLL